MRIFLAIIFLFTATVPSVAQSLEGTVEYKQWNDPERVPKRAEMFSRSTPVPVYYRLVFRDSISEYEREENILPGATIRLGFGPPETRLFKNLSTGDYRAFHILKDSVYLETYPIGNPLWKPEPGTMKIEGHLCKKARLDSSVTGVRSAHGNVVVWYAEDIPAPFGPDHYGSLPGLILALDINDGERGLKAVSVKSKTSRRTFREPANAMAVTSDQYSRIFMAFINAMPNFHVTEKP